MKKSIRSGFLALVFLAVLLSGCAPASTPVPPTLTFTPIPPTGTSLATNTPVPTDTPVPTETPTPVPAPKEPFAVVSADKAEFWFPLPDKEVWEWGFPGNFGSDYVWRVRFGDPQDYAEVIVSCGYPKPETSQAGSFEDMLKTCKSQTRSSSAPDSVPADGFFQPSYSNGGLLIRLTDPVWIEKLLNKKPQSMLYTAFLATRIMPSKTPPPSTGSYAVVLPDKAEFWFQLPDKTEWISNRPLVNVRVNNTVSSEYHWSVAFGGTYLASTFCLPERNKPLQTNSIEELLETCQSMLEKEAFGNWKAPTFSYSDGGLLMQLTDPETLEFLNKDLSQPVFFRTSELFDVTPTYE